MADAMPNYQVECQRLRMQIASLKANIERQKLEILEMEDRKRTALENIEATKKAISEYKIQLKELEEAHGIAAEADNGG
jgi:protein subunit release factor B